MYESITLVYKLCFYIHLQVNFQKFSGGYAPDPYAGEGLRRPSPDPSPLGAPALRAYRASLGASIVRPSAPPLLILQFNHCLYLRLLLTSSVQGLIVRK